MQDKVGGPTGPTGPTPIEGGKQTSDAAFQKMTEHAAATSAADTLKDVNAVAKETAKGVGAEAPAPGGSSVLNPEYQKMIDGLEKLIKFLQGQKDLSPSQKQKLKDYESQLATIQAHLKAGNLDDNDLQGLDMILGGINKIGSTLPYTQNVALLKKEAAMFTDMQNGANSQATALDKQIAKLQGLVTALNNFEAFLKELAAGKKPTKAELQKALDSYNQLMQNYGSLSPSQQTLVTKGMNALAGEGSPNAASLMGDLQIFQWTQEYYNQAGGSITPQGLKKFLEQKEAAFSKGLPNNNFATKMDAEMKGAIANIPMGTSSQAQNWIGPDGTPFGVVLSGQLNPNLMDYGVLLGAKFNQTSRSAAQAAVNDIDTVSTSLNNTLATLQSKVKQLKEAAAAYGEMAQFINSKITENDSLPNDVDNILINGVYPKEEKYLLGLAAELGFANFGAQMNNKFIGDMLQWDESSGNFNFNNWITGSSIGGEKNTYKQDKSAVDKHINNEIDNANRAIDQAKKLKQDIQDKINEVKNSKTFTPSQKKKLLDELNKDLKNVNALYDGDTDPPTGNLANLKKALEKLKADMKAGKGGTVTIPSADLNAVGAAEKAVIQGNPPSGIGGMSGISASINANQQDWASMSQTQQMKLQMEMTKMQQIWSLMSSIMQTLNSIYMIPAQGIKGG